VGCDNFHILGRFRAGPAYDQYEELLARTYDREAANWLDALEAVDALGLQLVTVKGEPVKIRDFQLEALDQVRSPSGVPVEFKFIQAE
jgi:hypothetical protein